MNTAMEKSLKFAQKLKILPGSVRQLFLLFLNLVRPQIATATAGCQGKSWEQNQLSLFSTYACRQADSDLILPHIQKKDVNFSVLRVAGIDWVCEQLSETQCKPLWPKVIQTMKNLVLINPDSRSMRKTPPSRGPDLELSSQAASRRYKTRTLSWLIDLLCQIRLKTQEREANTWQMTVSTPLQRLWMMMPDGSGVKGEGVETARNWNKLRYQISTNMFPGKELSDKSLECLALALSHLWYFVNM